jgi:di/tricarboxylate transporter
MMSPEAWITLAILIGMFALLIATELPAWAVFMGTLTVMLTLNLAPQSELLKGFSNPAVITVGALFIVAAGMYSTGAITIIADRIGGLPDSVRRAQLRILPPVAVGSAFLNNTPLVAMMIPVVRDLGRTAQLAVSKLYIPMSFGSILGGTSTLIGTSTNLIIAGLVAQMIASGRAPAGTEEPGIFFPLPVAGPVAVVGIAFVIVIGTRLLPRPVEEDRKKTEKRLYRAEFVVEAPSPLAGKTVEEAGFAQAAGYRLISLYKNNNGSAPSAIPIVAATAADGAAAAATAPIAEEEAPATAERKPSRRQRAKIWQAGLFRGLRAIFRPKRDQEPGAEEPEAHRLEAGDILAFSTEASALPVLWATIGLMPRYAPIPMDTPRHAHSLVEIAVAPSHPAVGRLVSELPVRQPPIIAKLVALSHEGRPPEVSLRDHRIAATDSAIVEVDPEFFYENRDDPDFLIGRRLQGYSIQRTSRAVTATVITLLMIILAAAGWLSMLNAALLGGFAMLLTGCMSLRTAARSVDWATLVVLAAAIGMEAAVTESGLSAAIANLLGGLAGDNPYAALTVVFAGAIVMTNLITNAAAAAFMFPIALAIAADLGVSFTPFVVILMMGTSYAFINPAGYQTNLMVQVPGGYVFMDYVRIGLPLTIIAGIIGILLAPLVYPF